MHVVMIMVMTADGVIAKDSNQSSFGWTSPEDKKHYVSITKEIGTVVMGGNTFRAAGQKSYNGRLSVVLTSDPSKYTAGDGVIFESGTPSEILHRLSAKGIQKVAIVGGAKVNSDFLGSGLVDELCITVEPLIFGNGIHIADGLDLNLKLELIECKQVNKSGTLILRYKIIK